MKPRKSPQEKKRLSLKKDRRSGYGENDKASRRIIPLKKRTVNRQNRKRASDIVSGMANLDDENLLEVQEGNLEKVKGKTWRKNPDVSLADTIKHSQKWRILREGRKIKSRNSEYQTLNIDDPRLDEI